MAIKMKTCTLVGNLGADSTSEQYPEEPVCVECIAEEEAKREDSCIVRVGESVTDADANCYLCDREIDDE